MQPVTTINTIETSSICNFSCPYCPCKDQHAHRSTGLMNEAVFSATLSWVRHFVRMGTQLEVNLSGVGEPLLHPQIVEMVAATRDVLGPRGQVFLVTNGTLVTHKIVRALFDAGLSRLSITDHNAKDTMEALRVVRALGVPHEYSRHAVTHPNNWGGLVEWVDRVDYKFRCDWLDRGQVAVLSDGGVTRCCQDAFGYGVFTTVFDDLRSAQVAPFKTCPNCHHEVPLRMRHLLEGRKGT